VTLSASSRSITSGVFKRDDGKLTNGNTAWRPSMPTTFAWLT